MSELCPMPGCRVERVARESPNLLHVAARGTRPGGRCPDCGRASRAVHSRYRRRPSDLPTLGSRVRVGRFVRRFYCRNPGCARRTFAERCRSCWRPAPGARCGWPRPRGGSVPPSAARGCQSALKVDPL